MATPGTVLKLTFDTAFGEKTWSFKHADPEVNYQIVQTAMDAMIANGSIYKYPPLARVSASLETTTVTQIDVE